MASSLWSTAFASAGAVAGSALTVLDFRTTASPEVVSKCAAHQAAAQASLANAYAASQTSISAVHPAACLASIPDEGRTSLGPAQPLATVTLSSGHAMPLVGLGTWKAPPGVVAKAVLWALEGGYRHIDCASVYGNEAEVGTALAQAFADQLVRRSGVFVTSKLWNSSHGSRNARIACLKSLADLQLDYVDLYLIHWPATGLPGPIVQPPLQETWKALEGLVDEGLVRSIGMSNFSARKIGAVLEYARIRPSVCQVEAHPYWRNEALLAWCGDQGIHVTAYSPLASPDSAALFRRRTQRLLEDPLVLDIARRNQKDAGQVLIRWALQRGTSCLPKSTTPARIASNLQVLTWELGAADMAALSQLPYQARMVDGAFLLQPTGPYRTLADLWD